MTWTMPAETAPQERIWMAFPPRSSYLADDPDAADAARTAWSAVANAAARFEPVTMVVDPADAETARRYLDNDTIDIVQAPLDDAWMRDIGPTFVLDGDGNLGAVDWVFNGWGQQDWARWEHDSKIGAFVADQAGVPVVSSPMVNEGGAIHVDGRGTALVTESVQLEPGRNPGWTKEQVEAELARTIGATHVVWVPRGLYRDSQRFGTRGHIDIVATIPSPGRLLVHMQNDQSHPDYAISRDILAVLRDSTDVTGSAWEIVEIPAPTVVRDDEGWVDYSYINHLVVNGGVIGCAFDDPHDDVAAELLAQAYPDREVVMVPARDIFAGGGGVHCITQQQPAAGV